MGQAMNVQHKSRLIWLDLLKGFCMILIVISHVSNRADIYGRLYTPIFLSAFFFASGYTFKPRGSFTEFLKNKIVSLGIPFVCLGLINACLAVVIERDLIVDRLKYLASFRGVWDDLWFIACLFSMQFILYGIYKLSLAIVGARRDNGIFILITSFMLSVISYMVVKTTGISLPLQFESACVGIFSMALGYFYKVNENKIDNIVMRVRGGTGLV
ncbi:MAG: acyltransferase family protein [Oscillospiraceae bacterium]|nr:acyltransferase family protein [Oscillospiraceae bacterium]